MLTLHKLELTGPAGTVRITATEATLLQAFAQSADARLEFVQVAQCMGITCWRRSNIDHLCRLNFDQGLLSAV